MSCGSTSYVVVVGGVNIDLCGKSYAGLIACDSNPGRVTTSLGGVGRNIAHNLALLGAKVHLVCALGEDGYARQIAESCQSLGIDLGDARTVPGAATSSYLCIEGPDGDMALAICDGALASNLTPEFLQTKLPLLCGAKAVVFDTNLPEESIQFLAAHCTAPLFCDPVSVSKAEKLRGVLDRLHTVKPNLIEAQLLSGMDGDRPDEIEAIGRRLLSQGVQQAVISLGAHGAYACDRFGGAFYPCLPINLVNATGGGDAMMAALAFAYLQDMPLPQAVRLSLAASAIAVECPATINPSLNFAAAKRRAGID